MFSGYYLQITGCKVVRASCLVPKSTSHNHCPCLQPWRPPLTLCNHGNNFNIANCDTCIKPITRCLDAMVTITTSYYICGRNLRSPDQTLPSLLSLAPPIQEGSGNQTSIVYLLGVRVRTMPRAAPCQCVCAHCACGWAKWSLCHK